MVAQLWGRYHVPQGVFLVSYKLVVTLQKQTNRYELLRDRLRNINNSSVFVQPHYHIQTPDSLKFQSDRRIHIRLPPATTAKRLLIYFASRD